MYVYPSKYVLAGNTTYGRLIMYRGAIMDDGTIVLMNDYIFWANMNMDEAALPNPLQQGDLICSETGECSIILTSLTTQIKAGEIYYLSFFPYSFSNIV